MAQIQKGIFRFRLQKIATISFLFFPISFSIFVQVKFLFQTLSFFAFFQTALFVLVLSFPLYFSFGQENLWERIGLYSKLPALWLVILSITLRVVVLPILSTSFSSDMEDVHNFAMDIISNTPMANLAIYPNIPTAQHLNILGLLMAGVYKIFGASFAVAKGFQVFLSALTTWLIYQTGKSIASFRIGFIAALWFATFLPMVSYTGVLSGEHMALCFLTGSILWYSHLKSLQEEKFFLVLTRYLLLGLLIGLIDWFRPVGIILLVAIVISDLIHAQKKAILFRLTALGSLIISYMFFSNLAVTISEKYFGVDILSASQRIGHFVFVGSNPETKGAISPTDSGIADAVYAQFGDDTSSAQKYLFSMTVERLKKLSVLDLLWAKFYRVWANQDALFELALVGSNDDELVTLMAHLGSIVYLAITFFVGFNGIITVYKRASAPVFAMQLFILGFALLLLLVEAQNRYAIVVYPYLMLLGALGLESMSEKAILIYQYLTKYRPL